jgi:hypothetical protein
VPETAIITQASSVIGWGFARIQPEQQSELIIATRRKNSLQQFQATLDTNHGVTVTVLAADLTYPAATADPAATAIIEASFGKAATRK